MTPVRLQEAEQLANEVIAEYGMTRLFSGAPSYRYFGPSRPKHGDRWFCWTTEAARDSKGRLRYASWVYRVQGKHLVPSLRRDFAKRKDAKARSLRLYQEHRAKGGVTMPKRPETLPLVSCPHCGHEWVLRVPRPVVCPSCGKRYPFGKPR